MRVTIEPGKLSGMIRAVPSKSEAHRHLICAALADAPTRIRIGATSADIDATIGCLSTLGAQITRQGEMCVVNPVIDSLRAGGTLDCGESGSSLRFLLPVAAALGVSARFVGKGRLPERPNGELIAQMRAHGVEVVGEGLPLEMRGTLSGGAFWIRGDVSSQYATGLLLALPLIREGGSIRFSTPVESRDYIELTRAVMRHYGVETLEIDGGYEVNPNARFVSPGEVAVGGDWSNAAFFLAANALGSDVCVEGLDDHSAQGDKAIVRILSDFFGSDGILRGIEIDASGVPDLVPVLAVVATQAVGETRIVRAGRLRLKESDRLAAMCEGLSRLGGDVRETQDGLLIRGGRRLKGGLVSAYGDHRIAMALAIAATVSDAPVIIDGAEAVDKSYPGFFEAYRSLRRHADRSKGAHL